MQQLNEYGSLIFKDGPDLSVWSHEEQWKISIMPSNSDVVWMEQTPRWALPLGDRCELLSDYQMCNIAFRAHWLSLFSVYYGDGRLLLKCFKVPLSGLLYSLENEIQASRCDPRVFFLKSFILRLEVWMGGRAHGRMRTANHGH